MIYSLLISLLGILVGFGLRLIAPEELEDSKKYIEVFQLVMFFIIFGVVSYYLIILKNYIYFTFVFIAVLFYYFKKNGLKKKKPLLEVIIYGIIILSYFLINQATLMASLIFLYGVPLGLKDYYFKK
jgi:hypothetical protein